MPSTGENANCRRFRHVRPAWILLTSWTLASIPTHSLYRFTPPRTSRWQDRKVHAHMPARLPKARKVRRGERPRCMNPRFGRDLHAPPRPPAPPRPGTDPREHPTEPPVEVPIEPRPPHPGSDPVEVPTEPRPEHPSRRMSDAAAGW